MKVAALASVAVISVCTKHNIDSKYMNDIAITFMKMGIPTTVTPLELEDAILKAAHQVIK